MAKSESKGAGDLGKHRPQVQSSVPSEKPAATAAESNRGDTAARRSSGPTELPQSTGEYLEIPEDVAAKKSSGPTELPPQFGRYGVKKKRGGGGMGTVSLVAITE